MDSSATSNRAKWTFGLSIFLSAFLLFQIEPIIAKIILPWFGGVAAVWSVCLLFFQVTLLLGYFYAHILTSRIPDKFRGWRMQDLRLGHRIVYDVKANWKLIVLNYNECLHCPNLHPALNKLHHYLGADNVAPTACYCGGAMGFREGVETMSMDGKRRRAYLPGLNEAQRQQVVYFAIYPNFLLSLHPDYVMTHTLWPRAHDRTEIVCEFHFHPSELARPDTQIDDAVEFWDLTNKEDWWIAEQSQAGINSRVYTPGPYSEREELLWSFDEIVRKSEES